jgi:UDPglucose 6-dehydrogenase
MANAKKLAKDVVYCEHPYDAVKDADALVILTEWDVFRGADFTKLKELMRGKLIFDGRNIFDPQEAREKGFVYVGIGV